MYAPNIFRVQSKALGSFGPPGLDFLRIQSLALVSTEPENAKFGGAAHAPLDKR